ncbi:cytochrome P450 [Boeremia exigua]|uniref:cytochrome P450 n=1 Tax=Boeremia exigua TaxID=749465 RepID=UPI001E8C9E30|nr:cytochrome P450 [Boeremia exigua]KAH6615387.1 cytochrome P450 [Boeremia exigua]
MWALVPPPNLTVLGLAIALVVFLKYALRFNIHPQEPPVVYPRIPLVGHIIGMLTAGATYFGELYEMHGYPIFTLPMFTGRTYIVTSPELASAVQKAPSSLELDPIFEEIVPRLAVLNRHTTLIMRGTAAGRKEGVSINKLSHKILTWQSISRGSHAQLGFLGELINNVEDYRDVDLFRFVRETVCEASNRTFFGPQNPFEKDPSLLDSFWDWENGLTVLMMGIFPSITARKSYRGFMRCARAFAAYIEAGGYENAHEIVQARNEMHLQHGIFDVLERGKLDVAMQLATNVNASIITFWLLSNVFSRPDLLARLRDEITENALVGPATLSLEFLRQSCPTLVSVFREILRLYAPLSSVRYIGADTMLANTYLVKKGAIIQVAGSVMHKDKSHWGPDAASFNPDRFLYSTSGTRVGSDGRVSEDKSSNLHPATFRSFGGGTSMCPGRNFAQAEILSLSAVLLLGFDMKAHDELAWNPPPDTKRPLISAMKPVKEVKVTIRRRKEFKGVKWELKL